MCWEGELLEIERVFILVHNCFLYGGPLCANQGMKKCCKC